MSRLAAVAFALALVSACRTVQNPPMPKPPTDTSASKIQAPPPLPPAPDPFAKAKSDVARLRAEAAKDPMLAEWTGPYGGVPPWDKVKTELFPAAFTTGIALRAAEVDVIAHNPEPPTFTNTYAALEDSGRHLSRGTTLFSVMTSNLNTADVQKVDEEWSPKLAAAMDAIIFNPKLFARMQAVYDARTTSNLTPEQQRLVTEVYEDFVRSGAKLTPEQKQEMGKINQDLATAFTEFSNMVLKDEDTWIVLESEKDLAGLGKDLVAAFKSSADERKLPGKWVVINTRSSVEPFLTSSTRRDLREKVWKAFKARGDNGGASDTNNTIVRIVELRQRRAKLLGYPTHAHWRMANTMAKDPAKADELMMRVWPAAVARVKEEVADMAKLAKKDGVKTFEPWDYLYYAEKVRKAKYALDQDEVKQYFELGNIIAGMFYMAEQLYDLQFTEITGKVPVFQPDVRVWEVKDKTSGKFRGLFYGDFFARAAKRSGAWQSTLQTHETFTGKTVATIASNNNNITKAGPGTPMLVALDDAETAFHEFGHALHMLLSEVTYPTLQTTPRDFVEYPSQVHEMWTTSRPILEKFMLHWKTKKPMPAALLKKIDAASKFNQGYATVEYLASAILDMKLHMMTEPLKDAKAFERETLAAIGAPREVAMRHRLPQFLHLFSSDSYSAGYYSYLWSEVMDADTREAFAEAGNVFDKTTADKLRKYILAPGNSTDRTEAYRQFRGRDPDVKALLEKRGFPVGKTK
jgi:peptidyl-dipeptidase Dcp